MQTDFLILHTMQLTSEAWWLFQWDEKEKERTGDLHFSPHFEIHM